MDWSLPGSSGHGILQGRILEWVAISSSRGPSPLQDRTQVSCIVIRPFALWSEAPGEPFWGKCYFDQRHDGGSLGQVSSKPGWRNMWPHQENRAEQKGQVLPKPGQTGGRFCWWAALRSSQPVADPGLQLAECLDCPSYQDRKHLRPDKTKQSWLCFGRICPWVSSWLLKPQRHWPFRAQSS